MINDMKKGIKLMRYAYGLKMTCIQAVAFTAVGLFLILGRVDGSFGIVGGFFWLCNPILPAQLLYSLNVTQLMQASPMRKLMQTSIPAIINTAGMVLIYLLEVLLLGAISLAEPEQAAVMGGALMNMAIMAGLLLVYLGVCYKYFVAATLCLVPTMVIWMQGGMRNLGNLSGKADIAFGPAALIGLGIVLLGGLAGYLLTLLFYKVPLSKMAQAAPLRKEL